MIQYPQPNQEGELLTLWKEIFGDHEGFWELFLRTGFSPRRCRVLLQQQRIAAALCWLECTLGCRRYAYLYAVMTHPDFRHRGFCRTLMDNTHTLLRSLGYDGVLLVPEKEGLRTMYAAMGYCNATRVRQFSCNAGPSPAAIRQVGAAEYAALRRRLLPEGGVIQEGESLAFLSAQAELFAGEDFLLAAYRDGDVIHGMELLGSPDSAPGILRSLGFAHGIFRGPGEKTDFAMFLPLVQDAPIPGYFGLAFD